MNKLDICICTFNRSGYLRQCLDALVPQLDGTQAGLIIIDNASTDDTQHVTQRYMHFPFIKTFVEYTQGLSHARNRGWKECKAAWILYIDDDCVARSGFVQNALEIISKHPAETAIGGPIYPLFEKSPPPWLQEGFGQFTMPYQQYTPVSKGYIRGGCMMIRREFLKESGGFSSNLGVKGKRLRYGEELELQERIRQQGGLIAYAPSLAIDHYVRPEKLSTAWILHAEYARRRDKMKISPLPILPLTLRLGLTTMKTVIVYPGLLIKSLIDKKYSRQKASLDALLPFMYRTGEWWGVISGRKSDRDKTDQ